MITIERDTINMTAVVHETKAAYLIQRGENEAANSGRAYSQSYYLGLIIDYWLKAGAPPLTATDIVTPVPVFEKKSRFKRKYRQLDAVRPDHRAQAAKAEAAATEAEQLRSTATPSPATPSQP
jgi:hypothetical protein